MTHDETADQDETEDAPAKAPPMKPRERAIIDRIRAKCIERGITMSALALSVGRTDNAGRQWNTYRSLPRHQAMMAVANALEVSVNWLLTGENEPADRAVTQIERETLSVIRELPVDVQEMLLAQARALADRERMKKP